MRQSSPPQAEQAERPLARYAVPVPRNIYMDNPEYCSHLEPRIHGLAHMADHGSMQCHIDMLGKEGIGSLSANMNPHSGGFASLVWPYTLPKRLALMAYIVEGLFIIDGEPARDAATRPLAKMLWQDVGMSEVEQVCIRGESNQVPSHADGTPPAVLCRWKRLRERLDQKEWETKRTGRVEDEAKRSRDGQEAGPKGHSRTQ